jgi:hypothetical protein
VFLLGGLAFLLACSTLKFVAYKNDSFKNGPVWKAENAAVGFDVLATCQPSTVWCSRKRLPAAAAQPAKVRQSL